MTRTQIAYRYVQGKGVVYPTGDDAIRYPHPWLGRAHSNLWCGAPSKFFFGEAKLVEILMEIVEI